MFTPHYDGDDPNDHARTWERTSPTKCVSAFHLVAQAMVSKLHQQEHHHQAK